MLNNDQQIQLIGFITDLTRALSTAGYCIEMDLATENNTFWFKFKNRGDVYSFDNYSYGHIIHKIMDIAARKILLYGKEE